MERASKRLETRNTHTGSELLVGDGMVHPKAGFLLLGLDAFFDVRRDHMS